MGATTIIMGMLLVKVNHAMVYAFGALLGFYVFVHLLVDLLRWWGGGPSDEDVHKSLLATADGHSHRHA